MRMNKIELYKELRIEISERDTKARNFALDNFELKAGNTTIATYDPDTDRFYFPCIQHIAGTPKDLHYIPTTNIQKIAEWIDGLYCDPDQRYQPVTEE